MKLIYLQKKIEEAMCDLENIDCLTVKNKSIFLENQKKINKAYKLLEGARGTTPAQMEQIEETLLRLSQLVHDFKFIDELDINPLLISEKTGEGIAVDGRIKVRMEEAQQALNYSCKDGVCACSL